jgi:predicted AlkP superfamily phosphohydrolase/phosphomutase
MKKLLIALILLVIGASLALLILPRINRDEQGGSARPSETAPGAQSAFSLSDEDSVFLADLVRNRPDRKVVVIGLDGASWNIIDPMIARGQLPAFKRLLDTSSYGDLRSVIFAVTPPGWIAMFSGCQPWQNGIYGFGKLDSISRTLLPVDATDVRVPMVWDMVSQAGLRTAIINVPVTYPAKPVNGIMVTGMLTPDRVLLKKITSNKKGLKSAAPEALRPYGVSSHSEPKMATLPIHNFEITVYLIDEKNDATAEYTSALIIVPGFEFRRAVPGGGGDSTTVIVQDQATVCGLEQFSSWLKLPLERNGSTVQGWVRLSPTLLSQNLVQVQCTPVYGTLARSDVQFCYPDSLKNAIARRFDKYIPFVPFLTPTIPDQAEDAAEYLDFFYDYDEWDLFIFQVQFTDAIQHYDGEGEYTQDVYKRVDAMIGRFMARLPENTVVIIASDHGAREYRFKVNLNVWLDRMKVIAKDREGNLDTRNSIAFHMYWGIYINEEELQKRWKVIPGFFPVEGKTLYDSFVDYLIEDAKLLTLPNTDKPLPVTIRRAPQKRVEPAPDLIVQPEYDRYAVHHEDEFRVGQDLILTPYQEGKQYAHRRAGMYLVAGDGIKRGYKTATKNIFDITPTILYLLGLPVADYFDGEIIRDVFEEEFLAGNKAARIHSYYFMKSELADDTDREALEEKLRAIGYIQ